MRLRRLAAVLGAGLAGGACWAQVTPSGTGWLFRVKFTPKETIVYDIPTTVSNLSSGPLKLKLKLDAKVLSVKGGIATIKGVVTSGLGGFMGGEPKQAVVKINDTGHEVGDSSLAGFCLGFPSKPLHPGDSFMAKVPKAGPNGGVAESEAKYTFAGLETDHGRQLARFNFQSKEKDAPAGSVLISTADGLPIRYYVKFKVPFGGSGQTASVTATFVRR